jgi:hypothetical protein
MSWYICNEGEREWLKSFLPLGVNLGLYSNLVVPDGSLTVAGLTELLATGGRGYAQIPLTRDLLETVETTAKWLISQDSAGKAKGQYGLVATPQPWTFNAVDVADATTVYGIFAFIWVLPFDAGSKEIKVGDTIKGGTSLATGLVTAVEVQSGTWAAGTAAGYLKIMTKTGTFQNDEDIYRAGEIATFVAAPTAAGDTYSVGDTFKVVTGGEDGVGTVLTLTGGDNSPVATIGVNPGFGGRNYTVGAGKVTTKLYGGGNDALTVEIATLATAAYAVSNTGVTGDAHKKLIGVEAFAAGTLIDTVGQIINVLPIFNLATAP